MATPWFVAPPERWSANNITLDAAESHHALDVLKVTPPDLLTVTDGHGRVARCAAARVESDSLVVDVLQVDEHRPLKPQLVVYQGAAKGRKLDATVEQLTELGVAEIWSYVSERAVVSWEEHKATKVTTRWQSIARAATKQTRSAFIPTIGDVLSWPRLVDRIRNEPAVVVLWEGASLPMRTALMGEIDRVALVVGPEGGLERAEAEALADAGGQLVSLGPRIFRTENAAVVAASSMLFHYGLIG